VSVGYPITKTDLDNTMGRLIVNLRDALAACVAFNLQLGDPSLLTDAALQSYGYTGSVSAGDIQTIRNAFTAMSLLNLVAHGGSNVPSAFDFFSDAKHLTGIN
jgi:hypothetical protein